VTDVQPNPTSTVTVAAAEPVTARLHYREAYRKTVAERAALDRAKLRVINIDIVHAYTRVVGSLPRIMALRDRASRLAEFEIENFDNLETHALALMHAQGEYVSASSPPEVLAALNEEGITLRDNLYSDGVALARRGLVSAAPLKRFRTAPGYKHLAEDLVGLSSLLRRSWDEIGSRTVVTIAELDHAEAVSERLLHAVAERENASTVLSDAIQKRRQAFTLLAKAYDQARRAISFLRWQEEDLDEIAPSLYAGRGRKKSAPNPPPAAARLAHGADPSRPSVHTRPER